MTLSAAELYWYHVHDYEYQNYPIIPLLTQPRGNCVNVLWLRNSSFHFGTWTRNLTTATQYITIELLRHFYCLIIYIFGTEYGSVSVYLTSMPTLKSALFQFCARAAGFQLPPGTTTSFFCDHSQSNLLIISIGLSFQKHILIMREFRYALF